MIARLGIAVLGVQQDGLVKVAQRGRQTFGRQVAAVLVSRAPAAMEGQASRQPGARSMARPSELRGLVEPIDLLVELAQRRMAW